MIATLAITPAGPLAPSDADLAFLRRLDDANERFDALFDAITAACVRPRRAPEQLVGVLLRHWQYSRPRFDAATWHSDELLAFLRFLARYRRLRGGARRVARQALVATVAALPSHRRDAADWLTLDEVA